MCEGQVAVMGDKYDDDDDGPAESVLDKDMVRVYLSSTRDAISKDCGFGKDGRADCSVIAGRPHMAIALSTDIHT